MEQINYDKRPSFSLINEYKTSLENPTFRKVVSKLLIDEHEIMKYTSLIDQTCQELNHCKGCKNILSCQNEINGYVYYPEVDNEHIIFTYKACKYQNEYLHNTSYQKYLYLFDVPEEIKMARMSNIFTDDDTRFEAVKYLTAFAKHYKNHQIDKGLYLHGNFGGGKTYLIAAMFNELALLKHYSAIVYWPEFLRSLKEVFGNDEFRTRFNHIKKAPLLLIDDLGAENMTAWARDEVLGPILQYRMQDQLPTFITSNLNLNELEEHLALANGTVDKVKARRIIERIKQLTVEIKMISINKRK